MPRYSLAAPALAVPVLAAALALALAGPAEAQKSKDTMRAASAFASRTTDYYLDRTPTTELISEAIFDTLVIQDLATGKLEPLLAKSWTRVSPTVLEFDLRDDVKWHDGQKFTADDVVSTLGWLIDPATNIVSKPNWAWIDKVEKLGDYKIRVTAKEVTPADLMRFAWYTPIYPKHLHGAIADKTQFGIKPVGTGPYKAVQVDVNQGFALERWDEYKWGGKAKPQNNFKRFEARGVPDASARDARFLVGETDIHYNVLLDGALQIKAQLPGSEIVKVRLAGWQIFAIPQSAAKLNPALGDVRVRRAMMMAIDRAAIEEMRSGDKTVWEGLCPKEWPGCGQTKSYPAYDPAGAKKLLAEAGYPNGFDLILTSVANPGSRAAAELVASQLSQVGIRPQIDPLIVSAVARKIADKQAQAVVYGGAGGLIPDASGHVSGYFMGQIADDPKIIALAQRSMTIADDAERRKVTAELFDIAVDQALLVPIQTLSRNFIHTKDVDFRPHQQTPSGEGYTFRQLNWKN